jgi:hypothetical protein
VSFHRDEQTAGVGDTIITRLIIVQLNRLLTLLQYDLPWRIVQTSRRIPVSYEKRAANSPMRDGREFAVKIGMGARRVLDRQAGQVPEIRVEGDNVTFCLNIAGTGKSRRLVLRCDADGNVWASVAEQNTGARRKI